MLPLFLTVRDAHHEVLHEHRRDALLLSPDPGAGRLTIAVGERGGRRERSGPWCSESARASRRPGHLVAVTPVS
jgi:hypothetical protein